MDRERVKQSIEEAMRADKIEELRDLIYENEPKVVLSALRKVEGGKNLVMLAVSKGRDDIVRVMLDMLELGVTAFNYWTSDEYAEYLCSTDGNGNNLLQLLIIHGRRNSDMMPQRVITHIKHNQKRLRDLVNNKNSDDKDSIDLANEYGLDTCFIGELMIYAGSHKKMMAVIFINKEHDNEKCAADLDYALRNRGFYVKHLNYTGWDRTSLCMELGKIINGEFDHLWVIGLTHGHDQHIEDQQKGSIRIEDIVQKVSEANAAYILIIIDACQTTDSYDNDNDSENNTAATEADELSANVTNAQPAHEGAVPQGETYLLITCSTGQKAWRDTFVFALVKYLGRDDVTDLYTILQLAKEEAAVPQGETYLLITCSTGQKAWGDTFVFALVKYLGRDDVTDLYTILQLAKKEAEETSDEKVNKAKIDAEKAKRDAENSNKTDETSETSETSEPGKEFKQTVQFPPNLAEGDITLPTNEE